MAFGLEEEWIGVKAKMSLLKKDQPARIAVLSAGAWGTALAIMLSRKGNPVKLWSRRREVAKAMQRERESRPHFPGVPFPATLQATDNLEEALDQTPVMVLVPASHGMRDLARQTAPYYQGQIVVSATKGLEVATLKRMSEVIREEIPVLPTDHLGTLSGPNFSIEVIRELPTASVVASPSSWTSTQIQELFMTPSFRVYTSGDQVGVELGGSLKNIYAIGVGIIEGLGLGQNARAAFITRGLAEMIRLGKAMGANPLTFSGLSGLGDLVLTCTGDYSRNRQAGLALGGGKGIQEILGEARAVIEGIATTEAAHHLAHKYGITMPIVDEMYQILFQGKEPRRSVPALMSRLKTEEVETLS